MINLLPSDYTQQKQQFAQKAVFLFVCLLMMAIMVYFTFSYLKITTKNQVADKKLKLAQNKLKSVNDRVELINKIKRKKKELKQKLKRREKVVGNQIDWASNLKELKNLIPDDSWLKEYTVQQHDQFYLRGYTLTRQELEEIVKRFKTSPYFTDISLDLVNKKKLTKSGYQPVEVVHYKLTGVLNSRSDTHGMVE